VDSPTNLEDINFQQKIDELLKEQKKALAAENKETKMYQKALSGQSKLSPLSDRSNSEPPSSDRSNSVPPSSDRSNSDLSLKSLGGKKTRKKSKKKAKSKTKQKRQI
jgi:hypothetical protein